MWHVFDFEMFIEKFKIKFFFNAKRMKTWITYFLKQFYL